MDFLTEFGIALIAGIGGAFALLKYLGKAFVQHQIDKSLKSFDAQLARKAEALKTELSIYAHEQNVALSRVDGQRAKAIQEVYSALRLWANHASIIATGSPLKNVDAETDLGFYAGKAEQAHKAGQELADTLANNAIYFDLDLYAVLNSLATDCLLSVANFLAPIRQGAAEGADPDVLLCYVEERRQEFSAIYQRKIQPAMQDVTDNFRKALGVIRAYA